MKFRHEAKMELGLRPIEVVPFINVAFLLLIFFVLFSMLVSQSGMKINLPRNLTSEVVRQETLVITLPSEAEMYFNGRKIDLKELQKALKSVAKKNNQLLIRANREVPMGRVTDVWNICRESGIEKVNIATTQQ